MKVLIFLLAFSFTPKHEPLPDLGIGLSRFYYSCSQNLDYWELVDCAKRMVRVA